jgi:hypothetical protein
MAANQERDFYREAAELLLAARSGTLATVSAGVPYAALVTPAVNGQGEVVLLFSELAVHTKHLRVEPACALLVAGAPVAENPQTARRVVLSGQAILFEDATTAPDYLRKHPYADLYFRFGDFRFWRLMVKDVHYIGGFAAAAHLDAVALQHEIIRAVHDGSG